MKCIWAEQAILRRGIAAPFVVPQLRVEIGASWVWDQPGLHSDKRGSKGSKIYT